VAKKQPTGRSTAPIAPSKRAASTPPSVRVPTEEDLDLAKNDALLQLRIGRSAHYYSILVAVALLFDAGLVLYLEPNLLGIGSAQLRSVFFLLFPLIGGVFLAAFGLRVKWETYQLWPWENHFWTSIGAVAFNGLLAYLYFASLFHVGATAEWPLLPWFYPAVLAGLTFALVGLALTWSEWTQRKTISVVAAILPIPFASVLYLFHSSTQDAVNALALSLSVAAVLYLISGGFLHIISSGTRTHEREVITSGQSRVFQVVEEVRRREEALRFREATLLKREADAEDTEAGLLRQRESVDQAKIQIDAMEAEIRSRTADLQKAETGWAARAAEANTLAQSANDKESDVALREQDLAARLPRLAEREQQVIQREGEQRQREVELGRREQEMERRLQGIPEGEANLERRRQEIERRTTELLQHESALRTRESTVGVAGAAGVAPSAATANLEEREARLNQLKMTLDEQNLILGRRAHQTEESLRDILRREEEIAHREAGVTSREAALTQREADSKERFDLGEGRRTQYETALRQYEEKIRAADLRDASLSARKAEVDRLAVSLQQRETQLKERDQALGVQRTTLDRIQRVVAERQKALDAREDELALRAQSVGRGVAPTGGPATAAADQATPVGELLAAPAPRRFADRAPSGTPRLDDLLQGGLPPRGHVMLVGDAFVGKEIVMYSFLAEGLKRGEPVVIVTTSRSPDEISQQVGLVAPQFREYEQLGKVSWIDASNPAAESAARPPSNHGTVSVVKGPDDHAGILSSLVAACKKAESSKSSAFRVGYLGLTSSLAHSDDRAGAVFVQNFAGILKPRSALAMYTVEAGALADARVEGILSRMDGAIRFKQEHDKTFLQVAGLGDVQTREWIECRATNRALVIGSFSLERIR